jgi:hypothetical protein
MSEIFKTRVEAPETPEIAPHEPIPLKSDIVPPGSEKAQEELTSEEEKLEIWEGLNRRKFGHDYFDIRETADTFPIKAEFGFIDKCVKAEMAEQGLDMNIHNYEKFLRSIEEQIGTQDLNVYKRINRIFQYLKTLQKYKEIKKRKDSYLSSQIPG